MFWELIKQFAQVKKQKYVYFTILILIYNFDSDQKVIKKPLFFSLIFVRIRGKRTRTKDQKQTIYFKGPKVKPQRIP